MATETELETLKQLNVALDDDIVRDIPIGKSQKSVEDELTLQTLYSDEINLINEEEEENKQHNDKSVGMDDNDIKSNIDAVQERQNDFNDDRHESMHDLIAVDTTTTDITEITETEHFLVKGTQYSPYCICGEMMEKQSKQQIIDDSFWCYCCEFTFNELQTDEYFFHCPNDAILKHQNGYNLCIRCSKEIVSFNRKPIKPIHQRENLYYLYNDDKINGPYLMDEIITNYLLRKLNTKIMYVMRADQEEIGNWTKLVFPQNIYTELSEFDEKRLGLIEECARKNSEIKEKYPEIYDALIEDVLSGKLRMVQVPNGIPAEEESVSIFRIIFRILGKITTVILTIILLLHCIPTIIPGLFLASILWCIITPCQYDLSDTISVWFVVAIFAISYFGIILVPLIDIIVISKSESLFEVYNGDEKQSSLWISYIVWGFCCYILSTIYVSTAYLEQGYETMSQFILAILFWDFSKLDIIHTGSTDLDWTTFIGTVYLFPAIVSLLPAAFAGYIAHFILNEKYELSYLCENNNNIYDEKSCYEDGVDCCEVILSQDYRAFIGGLAAYILAVWAVIRIMGYLLVNAFPQLEVYVNKKK